MVFIIGKKVQYIFVHAAAILLNSKLNNLFLDVVKVLNVEQKMYKDETLSDNYFVGIYYFVYNKYKILNKLIKRVIPFLVSLYNIRIKELKHFINVR